MSPTEAPSPRPGILKRDSEQAASPSSYLGIGDPSVSPRSTPNKSVTIAQQADTISPLMLGSQKSVDDFKLGHFRDSFRPHVRPSNKSRRSSGKLSNTTSPALKPLTSKHDLSGDLDPQEPADVNQTSSHVDSLINQVSSWIKEERARRSKRRTSRRKPDHRASPGIPTSLDGTVHSAFRERRGSDSSDGSLNLDKLDSILKQTVSGTRLFRHPSLLSIRGKSAIRKLRHKSSVSSDIDHTEIEFLVPSSDAVLDNSKTLGYTGGASDHSDESSSDELRHIPSYRDFDAWATFKFEIVRLTHTLRLKGWRKVPMAKSGAITVQRLSGALTNAVYVVSPPEDLPLDKEASAQSSSSSSKPPPKLLLRIYGPQVEHLIDREAELAILRRLARKRIGPRMLGTFANGRFEEFFHAQTLTAEDLRNADTSRQIAKRMRELHDGIDLLEEERNDGAFVWRNWDKWLARVEQVVSWMDEQVSALEPGVKPIGTQSWMRRGYICGVPWAQFKDAVEKYRAWLKSHCGGTDKLREQLVFAHNDTQYGNLLRLIPEGESPLLLPANTHKQLIVIDFEYASANTPGLEFANHFTEWCYNYHDKRKPYACNTNRYPTPEEQERFIRAYVRHRPHSGAESSTPSTPSMVPSNSPGEPARRPTTNISEFMLDARSPRVPGPSESTTSLDATLRAAEDAEVARLVQETRKWRLANTAQWVAWGMVQAKVPGMPDFDEADGAAVPGGGEATPTARELLGERADEFKDLAKAQEGKEPEEEQEEFDYLGYAQHRAMMFWGDAVQLGLVQAEDLPEETRAKIKNIPY